MAAAGMLQRSSQDMRAPMPDGELHVILLLHQARVVQSRKHRTRISEVGSWQCAAANDINGRDGKQRSPHAVAANTEQINREMIRIDPMISETTPPSSVEG